MMKRLVAVMVIGGALCAQAKITVDWSTSFEVKNFGGGTLSAGAIAQLIFSPDASISAVNPGTPFVPQGGEVLLGTFTFTGVDGYIDVTVNFTPGVGYLDGTSVSYGAVAGTPTVLGGMVYTRAFNSGLAPTYYGEGGMDVTLTEQIPGPASPDASDMAKTSDFELTTPIPEPGVGVLVLAGAAVAMFRRRRQQD